MLTFCATEISAQKSLFADFASRGGSAHREPDSDELGEVEVEGAETLINNVSVAGLWLIKSGKGMPWLGLR
jgi:hypothetical protein